MPAVVEVLTYGSMSMLKSHLPLLRLAIKGAGHSSLGSSFNIRPLKTKSTFGRLVLREA